MRLITNLIRTGSGYKQPIDVAEWTITTLTHTGNPYTGFTTSVGLEVKIDGFEIE